MRIRPTWPGLPALAFFLSIGEPGAGAAEVGERLQRGEIIAFSMPARGVQPGRAMVLIDAPPAVVRDILTRFGAYPSFVPRIVASREVKQNRYVIESDFPWPVSKTWVYLQVQSGSRDGVEIVTWKMLNGTLKAYEGVAWIQPWTRGRTLLTYQMLAVPNTIAPDALMSYGLREAVSGMADAVRKRAQKLLADNPALRMAGQPDQRTH